VRRSHAQLGEPGADNVVLHGLLGQETSARRSAGWSAPPRSAPGSCAPARTARPAGSRFADWSRSRGHQLAGRAAGSSNGTGRRPPCGTRADQVGVPRICLSTYPAAPAHDRGRTQRLVVAERGQHEAGHLGASGNGSPGTPTPRRPSGKSHVEGRPHPAIQRGGSGGRSAEGDAVPASPTTVMSGSVLQQVAGRPGGRSRGRPEGTLRSAAWPRRSDPAPLTGLVTVTPDGREDPAGLVRSTLGSPSASG